MHYFKPSIMVTPSMVSVEAPYNSGFVRRAGELGGVFRDKKWHFSYRDEIEVRKATEKYFGYDGLTDPIQTDIKVTFNNELLSEPNKSLDIVARPIARITNRSDKPLIAPGTLIESGSITAKGTQVRFEKGTELTLRAVPMSLVENHQEHPDYQIEIIKLDSQALEMLFMEYDQLVKRFNEVHESRMLTG